MIKQENLDREAAETQIRLELYGDCMINLEQFYERLADSEELEALVLERITTNELVSSIDDLTASLRDATEALRSCHEVAKRRGQQTNWNGLAVRLERILRAQHTYLYPQTSIHNNNATTLLTTAGREVKFLRKLLDEYYQQHHDERGGNEGGCKCRTCLFYWERYIQPSIRDVEKNGRKK